MANGKPGRPKGLPKTGGRKVGSVSKKATLVAQKLAQTELSADVTVEAIRRGALADIGDVFTRTGDIKPLHEMTEAQRWMIAGVEVVMKNAAAGDDKVDRILKIKWADRAKYVEMAAKYHALLTDKVEHDVTDALLAKLDRGRARARGDA